MNKKKKYRRSLRSYMMAVSMNILIWSCLVAVILIFLGIKITVHGELTHELLGVIVLIFCILVILIDGLSFWFGSKHLIRPLLEANDVVMKVAQGDFKVQINRRKRKDGDYEYVNEIDELSKNVNKMVNELDGMEYMRKDFMRNVSHEVKTPIAAITGFTEILLDGQISEEEQREYLEIINKESIRISKLCQNMLSMATLDNQVIVTTTKPIRLDEQIRKCIILLSEKWSEKEVEFSITLDPIMIETDADMLQQVWINLLDNAIKYSKEQCKITIEAREQEDGLVEVEIKDNGIGIQSEKISKIFDSFYQCEESHKVNGNGLGLSIVKRILELLEGTIVCESIEGKGTTMRVVLKKQLDK
ncbi:MAG: HAMP domain-containing sensor histidine kinase [bacterium]|nr:HAMP domain-containing sensor histidine kinase [bacterium]